MSTPAPITCDIPDYARQPGYGGYSPAYINSHKQEPIPLTPYSSVASSLDMTDKRHSSQPRAFPVLPPFGSQQSRGHMGSSSTENWSLGSDHNVKKESDESVIQKGHTNPLFPYLVSGDGSRRTKPILASRPDVCDPQDDQTGFNRARQEIHHTRTGTNSSSHSHDKCTECPESRKPGLAQCHDRLHSSWSSDSSRSKGVHLATPSSTEILWWGCHSRGDIPTSRRD